MLYYPKTDVLYCQECFVMSAIAIIRASLLDYRKSWAKLLIFYAVLSGIFLLLQIFLNPTLTRYAFQYNEVVRLWCNNANIDWGQSAEHYGINLLGISLYFGNLLLGWLQSAVVALPLLLILKRPDASFKDQYRHFIKVFFRFFSSNVLISVFFQAYFLLETFFTGLPFRLIGSSTASTLAILIRVLFFFVSLALFPFWLFYSTFWSLSIFEDGLTVWSAFKRCWSLLTGQFWQSIWTIVKVVFFMSLPVAILIRALAFWEEQTYALTNFFIWVILVFSTPLVTAAYRHIYLALDGREIFLHKSRKSLSDRFQDLSQEVYDQKKAMGLLSDEEEHILPDPITGEPLWASGEYEDNAVEWEDAAASPPDSPKDDAPSGEIRHQDDSDELADTDKSNAFNEPR